MILVDPPTGDIRMSTLILTARDNAINDRLGAELADVEARFNAELISDLPCVNDLVSHIEQYRGKMLRPTLVLVSAMACAPCEDDGVRDSHRVLATVIEMVHMATLVHDDILDDADVRRRGSTINHLAGNEAAVMLGDYLISHAYHLCSSLGDESISRVISETTNAVCEGELLQLANRGNWSLDESTYFEIIRRKTASLCGTCCRLSARFSGANAATTDGLSQYGQNVGVAFQIIDDLLDLTGSQATVGKTLGRDLEKGKLTLPLIRYMSTADDSSRQAMIDLMSSRDDGPAELVMERVREAMTDNGAVDYARRRAEKLTRQAVSALDNLPESAARTLLGSMAEAVLNRRC